MIDWSKQHCGVRSAPYEVALELMPDLREVLETFPDTPALFSFDVKVHMLMPRQYPCIPHWHVDNVPRVNGVQRFDLCRLDLPMYCWVSGPPLTQFEHGYLLPERWHRFTQADKHRGTAAAEFGWRGFVRATHVDLGTKPYKPGREVLRRHTQVYCDENTYQW